MENLTKKDIDRLKRITNHGDLEKREYAMIARLLRIKRAYEDMDDPELADYISEKYEVELNKGKLNKLKNLNPKSGYFTDEGLRKGLKNFLIQENNNIATSLFIDQFSTSFNFTSSFEFIKFAENASSCVFWNTYLDLNQWHSPLIRMHLSIQKSIEQRNNFKALHKCHTCYNSGVNNHAERKKVIKNCIDCPPIYRHYRILILPLSKKEFQAKINDKSSSFYKNFRFSTLIHCTLSFQLAVLTTTDFATIIAENETDFFEDVENLNHLGLNSKISNLKDNAKIEVFLKDNILKMNKPPNDAKQEGCLDFTYVKGDENISKPLWSAYNDPTEGLTYYPFVDGRMNSIKIKFSELVFNKLTVSTDSNDPDNYAKLDPLFSFYQNYNRKHLVFKNIYNARKLL